MLATSRVRSTISGRSGPAITIVGNSIDANNGVVPSDGVIQIAFDRYLLPSTITRQSYVILDNTNTPLESLALKTVYDPVARTVTIIGPDGPGKQWLTPDQSYKLVLPIPKDPKSDLGGFRAIDRATLHANQKLEIVFRAGPPTQQTLIEPAVDFCADVFPIFFLKCSGPTCHGPSDSAASSLVLGSSDGVRVTARERIAQGSNTAGARQHARDDAVPVRREHGDHQAGRSRIELARLQAGARARAPSSTRGSRRRSSAPPPAGAPSIPAPAPAFATLAPAHTSADEIERAILNDYVLGPEMPYPYTPETYTSGSHRPTTTRRSTSRSESVSASGSRVARRSASAAAAASSSDPDADAGAPSTPDSGAPADSGAPSDASDQ